MTQHTRDRAALAMVLFALAAAIVAILAIVEITSQTKAYEVCEQSHSVETCINELR
jgi:cell division protein FtsL